MLVTCSQLPSAYILSRPLWAQREHGVCASAEANPDTNDMLETRVSSALQVAKIMRGISLWSSSCLENGLQ
jgi:hypothetical protein